METLGVLNELNESVVQNCARPFPGAARRSPGLLGAQTSERRELETGGRKSAQEDRGDGPWVSPCWLAEQEEKQPAEADNGCAVVADRSAFDVSPGGIAIALAVRLKSAQPTIPSNELAAWQAHSCPRHLIACKRLGLSAGVGYRPKALRTAGITSCDSSVMPSHSRARLEPEPSMAAINRPPNGPVRSRKASSFSVTVLGDP